jgi:hypothetical protein
MLNAKPRVHAVNTVGLTIPFSARCPISMLNAKPPAGQVTKAVDHPHCIKLYDVFEDREKCYLLPYA